MLKTKECRIKEKLSLMNINRKDCFFAVIFLSAMAFLIYKLPYGYIFNDEPFIISLAHRLLLGDALLVDEWHVAQMTGFLQLPFVWLYTVLTGGMTGIILYIRGVYLFLWTAVCLFGYVRLRKTVDCRLLLAVATVYLYLFSALDQMTLSYNFFSLSGVFICSVLLITAKRVRSYCLAGLFFAVAVVACPMLIFVFILAAIVAIAIAVYERITGKTVLPKNSPLKFKNVGLIFAGAASLGVAFAVFVFSRASLAEILQNLPLILQDCLENNSHQFVSFYETAYMYVVPLYRVFGKLFVVGLPILAVSLLDKKRSEHAVLYVLPQAVVFLYYMRFFAFVREGQFNYYMLPIVLLGLQSYVLTKKRDSRFLWMWIAGGLFSVCVYLTSNLGVMAISFAMSIAGFASFISIGLMAKEQLQAAKEGIAKYKENKKISLCLISSLLTIVAVAVSATGQLASESYIRYMRTYWDGATVTLNTRINDGVAKDIVTTKTNAEEYTKYSTEVTELTDGMRDTDKRFLSLASKPWIYLEADMKYGSPSAWMFLSSNEEIIEVCTRYIEMHPEHRPDVIYVHKSQISDISELEPLFAGRGYEVIETEYSYFVECKEEG